MKLLPILLFAVLSIAHAAEVAVPTEAPQEATAAEPEEWEKNPILSSTNPVVLRNLRALRQDVVKKGCPVNLCFGLQGDHFVTLEEYIAQKNFVELIVAITTTDEKGNFCAVQYGKFNKKISKLTRKKLKFLDKVESSRQVGGSSTNIGGALAYMGFQLRTRIKEPRKIILLGDGQANFGAKPERVAKKIRKEGTELCAIAVGKYQSAELLATITNDPNRVMAIDQFLDLSEIVVAVIHNVCSLRD